MALQPTAFISPAGELAPALFPGTDLTEAVGAWIDDAEERSTSENAQRSWVYYRAYRTIANRLHSEAASERKGPVAAARIGEQLRYWEKLAADHLQDFHSLSGLPVPILQPVRYT